MGAAGAYWVMSARSSLPRKLSWWIWCQERRPSGACRGEVAAPASAWAGSGWALSLDHFHLTGDNTDKKQTAQAIRMHAHSSTAGEPRGQPRHRHGVSLTAHMSLVGLRAALNGRRWQQAGNDGGTGGVWGAVEAMLHGGHDPEWRTLQLGPLSTVTGGSLRRSLEGWGTQSLQRLLHQCSMPNPAVGCS